MPFAVLCMRFAGHPRQEAEERHAGRSGNTSQQFTSFTMKRRKGGISTLIVSLRPVCPKFVLSWHCYIFCGIGSVLSQK